MQSPLLQLNKLAIRRYGLAYAVILTLLLDWSVAYLNSLLFFQPVKDKLPSLKIDYHPSKSHFDETKLALLFDTQPRAYLAPLLLHTISVVPPEWPFVFLGTPESVERVNRSLPIQLHVASGKLKLEHIPSEYSIESSEDINRMMTNMTFYEKIVDPAEHLLLLHSDSILCARSRKSLNDWLDFDWVGAPWDLNDPFGGSGGQSLRKVSSIKRVLGFQARLNDGGAEDRWLSTRIGLLPGSKMANATQEAEFSVDRVYHEQPMGYHVPRGSTTGPVWAETGIRKKIFDHCPEIKMILPMRFTRESCKSEEDYWGA